jgi:hypothetical protein
MMTFDHQHARMAVQVRHPFIVAVLALLHLPYMRFLSITSEPLPCDCAAPR